MPDLDRIRAVKEKARNRLLAIPGVHSVAIGARKVGGQKTAEPAIVVFVVKKKPAAELKPEEMIPAEIDGIKTDVVEEELPRLFAGTLPDEEPYDVMEGGIQIQAGTGVTGYGTLGCIARTDDPVPKIVALTCHHVVALWSAVNFELKIFTSRDKHQVIVYGANVSGVQLQCWVKLVPTGPGTTQFFGPFNYQTTNADTPVTIATSLAGLITAAANPNFNVTASTTNTNSGPGGNLQIAAVGAFDAQFICELQPVWATLTGTKVATFSGIIRAGFIVVVHIIIVPIPTGDFQYLDVFYTMVAGDTLHSVAVNLANAITALANPGVTAAGPVLGNGTEITITSGANVVAAIDEVDAFMQMVTDSASTLDATVAGNVITLSGRVGGDDYGIYTNVNAGGAPHSFGLFLQPAKNTPLNSIASTIAGNLTSLNIPNVTVTANAAQITVAGAEEVECHVSSDIRVGQPVNSFGSSCSHCCSKRFGRVLDARLELDTAVIQLDPGKKYKAEVEGIGVVTGSHEVTGDEAMPGTYAVKKRGRTTGLTNGTIDYLNADGNIGGEGVFHRHYTDAIKISGNNFSAPGDSGSAVLNSANEVVGILFGGGATTTYVTPIQTIASVLNVVVESATAPGNVQTVPTPASVHAMAMLPEGAQSEEIAIPAMPPQFDWDRLREAELEIAATPVGNEIIEKLRRHIPETQTLVLHNRRFAATWRRYGGPLIVQGALRMAQTQDQRLPQMIKGRPLMDCLRKIQEMLVKCASPELCRDLEQYQTRLESLLTLTYAELIFSLQALGQE
jgi:hypothetical protein